MWQTKTKRRLFLSVGFLVAIAFLLLPFKALAQSSAFQDLPQDHWAFTDVDFLVSQGYMEGYPDGTFKGRKVTTRYDVALILARILKRMEERKAMLDQASEEERAALSRLTKEFRDELGLLDVRVDSLERRMVDSENKVKSLEGMLPKVKVSGFYRGRGQFIVEPETVQRNEFGDRATFTDPGLVTFYQQMFLRFTGKPAGEKIETFYELLGYIQGRTWNQVVYNQAGNSTQNPFDNIDDYVRYVQNDNYVRSNKMHIISRARSMKVRVFAGESVTGLDNPTNFLTEDTNLVNPYQGVEVSGSESGVSYQASILKSDLKLGFGDTSNMLTGRMVWKLPEKFSEDTFSVGTSYAEKITDYKTRGNSNTVRGVDLNFSTERAGKIQATAEFMTSTALLTDTSDNKTRNLGDEATRFDLSIQNGGLTGTLKHYDFGRNFRAMMAPVWAYDVGEMVNYPRTLATKYNNYGRKDMEGEKLTRFSVNYDFGNKLLAIANNLSMEAAYLSKTWEVDPYKAKPTDGYSGRKFTFQLLSDFTDNTTVKYDFTQKWDALEGEQGWKSNAVELNLKLSDSVSSKGKIFVLGDPDDVFEQNGVEYDYNERVGYFELNSDINPRVYAKGSVEHQVRWVNSPKEDVRVDYIGEATYSLTPTTSFTGGIQHVDYENREDGSKSSLANAIIAELKKNFTNKFRGRAFYSRGIIDFKDGMTDSLDRENIYGELIYDVNKDATILFKFGYDYPYEWRWAVSSNNNGRDYVDIHTQKMFIFEARSNF